MIKHLAAACGLAVLPMATVAQSNAGWTLQACIDHALTHNVQLQKSLLESRTAAQTTRQSQSALLPSLSASLSEGLAYRPFQQVANNFVNGSVSSSSADKTTLSGNYGINASWTVWNGNQNRNTIRANQMAETMARLATDQAANSIQEQIAQLYIQILYTQKAEEVNRTLLRHDSALLSRGRALQANGKMAQADVAQLAAQMESGRYDVVNARTQIATYKTQLRQLLQLEPGSPFDVVAPDSLDTRLLTNIPEKSAVYEAALESRPEIKSSRLAVEQSNVNLKIAKGAYSPTISLSAGLNDSHMTGTDRSLGNQLRNNFDGQIGVNVAIPLFDNRQRKTNVEKAKIQQLSSRLDLKDNQLNLYNAIENYWLEAVNNQQKYEAAKSQVESLSTSYTLTNEQFKEGVKNIAELLTSRSNLLAAQQTMLQSQYTALLNIALLKFYQNEKIAF